MSRGPRPPAVARAASPAVRSSDSAVAAEVKALVLAGDRDGARHRFGDLVEAQQRRAVRLAFRYLGDTHDADEAVQDAFVKVFTHITSYREELPFEVWFTRILVNACLDMRKARARRLRWVLPIDRSPGERPVHEAADGTRSVEDRLIGRARMKEISAAVDQLPDRQRLVFVLSHVAEHSTSQIGRTLGLSEATVRVHLFRAVRKLRSVLGQQGNDAQGRETA